VKEVLRVRTFWTRLREGAVDVGNGIEMLMVHWH